jgi:hypothetical protein
MPSGYLNRLGPAYWSSIGLAWTGTAWVSSGAISTFTMTPSAEMAAHSPAITTNIGSLRMVVQVSGVRVVHIGVSGSYTAVIVLSGATNERFVQTVLTNPMIFTFDASSAVTIAEIECGLVGTF